MSECSCNTTAGRAGCWLHGSLRSDDKLIVGRLVPDAHSEGIKPLLRGGLQPPNLTTQRYPWASREELIKELDKTQAEVQRLREQIIHDAEYSNRLSRQLKVYHDAVVLRPFKMFAVPDADPVAIPETGSLAALLEVQAQHDWLVTRITAIIRRENAGPLPTGEPAESVTLGRLQLSDELAHVLRAVQQRRGQ